MATIHFTGRVLPSVLKITLQDVPQVRWQATDIGLDMTFTISITDSIVDIECEANRFNQSDVLPLYMRALDLARASVDLVAFAGGYGATVFLDTIITPEGSSSAIFPESPEVRGLCTAFTINSQAGNQDSRLGDVFRIVFSEPALFMALNDLISGITLPHHAPVNCARAIESLRNLIAPPGTSRKDAWDLLRENLRVEKDYLEYITGHSTGPRHGDRSHIPGTRVTEITRRAWVVMNRFLEFRKRLNEPLPTSEFPLLS